MGFGATCVALSGAPGLLTLAIGFIGIRLLGQGGPTLVATTGPGKWFDRRRRSALGFTTAIGSALTSILPILSAAIIILIIGRRVTWAALGVTIWLIVLPIARWGLVDDPIDLRQRVDGRPLEKATIHD